MLFLLHCAAGKTARHANGYVHAWMHVRLGFGARRGVGRGRNPFARRRQSSHPALTPLRYYYSPWRAPGSAPVFDPCGMAGGTTNPHGMFGAEYVNTTHAKVGDLGSKVCTFLFSFFNLLLQH